MIEWLWAYVLVFLLGATPFFEAFAVIPIGILTGLSVIPTIVLGLAGNIMAVFLVIVFIDSIKQWLRKRKGKEEEKDSSKRSKRAKRIWQKYGLPGLAMIGPFFVGSHLTAFLSVTFGGTRKRTFIWVTASIITWSLALSILAYFGIDFLGFEDIRIFESLDLKE